MGGTKNAAPSNTTLACSFNRVSLYCNCGFTEVGLVLDLVLITFEQPASVGVICETVPFQHLDKLLTLEAVTKVKSKDVPNRHLWLLCREALQVLGDLYQFSGAVWV